MARTAAAVASSSRNVKEEPTQLRSSVPHDFFSSFAPMDSKQDLDETGEMACYRARDLDSIVSTASDAVAVFDSDMRYMKANQRWMDELGLSGTTFIGRSHFEVFPDANQTWRKVFQQALKGQGVSSDEEAVPAASSRRLRYQWEVRPWRRIDAQIGGIVVKWDRLLEGRKKIAEKIIPKELPVTDEPKTGGLWESSLHVVAMNSKGRVLRTSEGAAELFGPVNGREVFLWEAYGTAQDDPAVCKEVLASLKTTLRNPTGQSLLALPVRPAQAPRGAPLHWQLSVIRGPEWGEQRFAILGVGVSSATEDAPLPDVEDIWQLPDAAAPKPKPPVARVEVSSQPLLTDEAIDAWESHDAVAEEEDYEEIVEAKEVKSPPERSLGGPVRVPAPMPLDTGDPLREAMLRFLPDVVPCGIVVADERGCCVYHNSVLALLVGRRIHEGQRIEEYLSIGCRDERHRREVTTGWRSTIWARQTTHILTLATTDGQLRKMELRPVVIPGGLMMISFRDVTAEVWNETILENSARILRRTLLQSPTAVLLAGLNGEVRDVNDAAVNLLGYSAREWMRLAPEDWLASESLDTRDAAYARLNRDRNRKEVLSLRLRHQSGSLVEAKMHIFIAPDAEGEPLMSVIYLESVVKNGLPWGVEPGPRAAPSAPSVVTEEDSLDFTLLMTDHEGQIVEWTEYASECFGYEGTAMVGRRLHEIFRPGDPESFYAQMQNALRKPKGAMFAWQFQHGRQGRRTAEFHVEATRGGGLCSSLKLHVRSHE